MVKIDVKTKFEICKFPQSMTSAANICICRIIDLTTPRNNIPSQHHTIEPYPVLVRTHKLRETVSGQLIPRLDPR